MKKAIAILMAGLLAAAFFAGCSAKDGGNTGNGGTSSLGEMTVISREEGSGTRGAFIELFGIEQKDASGKKVDRTMDEASITSSTSVMMTSVAQNESAIGYISLGSMNDTVKALAIDGAEASVANIKSGSYKVARPFNIVTKEGTSEAAKDFISFILAAEGQAVVEKAGYIAIDNAPAYNGNKPSGKIVVAGSSSVTPVMEKLKEAYLLVNGNAQIEIQQSDSTTGVTAAIEGICDIGMASRALKDSEKEKGAAETTIATDGIAVIINKNNPVNSLSKEQVCSIYTGEITDWSEITA